MKTKILRTKAEKVLYPIAIVFSAGIWLLLIATAVFGLVAFISPSSSSESASLEPCVFIFDDEYYFATYEKARLNNFVSDCLGKADIPDEIYLEAQQSIQKEDLNNKSDKAYPAVILLYVFLFFGFNYAVTALAIAYIRLNGVRIGQKQYPAFYEIYEKTAKELGLKQMPRAYIIHAGGILNAFAIKISWKKIVVFYADLVEALMADGKIDELKAVVAHELTHVRLKHTHYWIFLSPFGLIPFLPQMLSRARERSADKGGFMIVKDQHAVIQALVKLATGRFVAKEINVDAYVQQLHYERGFFIMLAKLLSSHPPIPSRIKSIRRLSNGDFEEE